MTTKTKLSVRKKPIFKKSYSSSSSLSSLNKRRDTLRKKAYELSILCDADVCIICYGRDGELTTWPEDKSKVRDVAERFSRLNDRKRLKKSTDLSQVLKKKMNDQKKRSFEDNDKKFSGKIMEMEQSLERCLRMLREKLLPYYSQDQIGNRTVSTDLTTSLFLNHQQWTEQSIKAEPDQSGADLSISSSSLNQHRTEQLMKTEPDQSRADLATSSSSLNQPSILSFLLYDHDNGVFTPLLTNSDLLLDGLTSCSKNHLPW